MVGYRKESSGEGIEFISVLSKIIQEREATVGRSHGQETRWIIIQGKPAASIGGNF